VNPFGAIGSGLARLFSTHPPPEERIRRLVELSRSVRAAPFDSSARPRSRLVRG
jgi:hypothetical protein